MCTSRFLLGLASIVAFGCGGEGVGSGAAADSAQSEGQGTNGGGESAGGVSPIVEQAAGAEAVLADPPLAPPGDPGSEAGAEMGPGSDPSAELPPPASESAPTGHSPDLLGYWRTGSEVGNCIDIQSFLRFLPDGQAESIVVDADACYPEQHGKQTSRVSYSLDGRTLTLTDAGSVQRFNIATSSSESGRTLYRPVFVALDPLTWSSSVLAETYEGGVMTKRSLVSVDLAFKSAVGAATPSACAADAAYSIESYQLRDADGVARPAGERLQTASGSLSSIYCRSVPTGNTREIAARMPGSVDAWAAVLLQSVLPRDVDGLARLLLNAKQPDYLYTSPGLTGVDALPADL